MDWAANSVYFLLVGIEGTMLRLALSRFRWNPFAGFLAILCIRDCSLWALVATGHLRTALYGKTWLATEIRKYGLYATRSESGGIVR